MHIVLVGLNHKTAPVHIREKVAFPTPAKAGEACRMLCDQDGVTGAVVLSTCNRTELYACTTQETDLPIRRFLNQTYAKRTLSPECSLEPYLYSMSEADAVRHLMEVAAGLDSMILGEGQVLGQVRSALQIAEDAGTAGGLMSAVFQHALQAGKRVRAETQISRGAVSVSGAAVELARDIFGSLSGRCALIVGAGETGELTVRLLAEEGVSSVIVANRTFERAQELACKLGGSAVQFDALEDAMVTADIVISSTAATHAVIRKDQVQRVMRRRHQRPIFLIDIAVPRDVEPDVGRMENVFLYDMDDLQRMVEHSLRSREQELSRARAIVEEELDEFMRWRRAFSVSPVLAELQQRLEEIRQAEIAKTERRLSHLSHKDWEALDILTRGIVKRILKEPIRQLKDHAQTRDGFTYLRAVRHLFGLDGVDDGPEHRRGKEDQSGNSTEKDGEPSAGTQEGNRREQ
ncbi:MAG: glutamyl-tRNA reductase [Armatimonadota bacterium]